MKIIEQTNIGKLGEGHLSEDVILLSPGFIAVIDGATDKWDRSFNGLPGGIEHLCLRRYRG
jgi:hypothetical protein